MSREIKILPSHVVTMNITSRGDRRVRPRAGRRHRRAAPALSARDEAPVRVLDHPHEVTARSVDHVGQPGF